MGNWQAYLSMDTSGASLDTYELVKQPAGVEMVSDMAFELIDDDE